MTDKIELNLELWPRQYEALTSEATEILFGGATGGGKSHLIRVALISWCLAIPGLQCALIRRKYDDILRNHVEGPTGFKALLAPLVKSKQVVITQKEIRFPEGSNLAFIHCQDERQFDSAQGVEKHVLVLDEATQISERLIRFFRGWCRMAEEMKAKLPAEFRGKFPRILYTANPIGTSVPFFRRNFVKARAPFEIEAVEGFKRQFIPSKLTDNPSIDAEETRGRLLGLGDASLAKALEEGDWDAPLGEMFPQYNDERHVTAPFTPPPHWFKFITFDWGAAEPFAVMWWAVSDGVHFFDAAGKERWFPRGALVAYREWYGCLPTDPAKGCGMRNKEIAEGVLARTPEEWSGLVVTDSLPFQDRGMEKNGKKYRIADEFKDAGLPMVLGNCARITGWSMLRDRLIGQDGWPMIFFSSVCKYARDYIPALERSKTRPEDAAESGEATHICDVIRLACTTRPFVYDQKAPEKEPEWKKPRYTPKSILRELMKQGERSGFYRQ